MQTGLEPHASQRSFRLLDLSGFGAFFDALIPLGMTDGQKALWDEFRKRWSRGLDFLGFPFGREVEATVLFLAFCLYVAERVPESDLLVFAGSQDEANGLGGELRGFMPYKPVVSRGTEFVFNNASSIKFHSACKLSDVVGLVRPLRPVLCLFTASINRNLAPALMTCHDRGAYVVFEPSTIGAVSAL